MGQLASLVPGQRLPSRDGQLGERGDECIAHRGGIVAVGQGDQVHVAAAAVDQGRDRRPVITADNQVALPVPDAFPTLDDAGSWVDELARCDEPRRAFGGAPAPLCVAAFRCATGG